MAGIYVDHDCKTTQTETPSITPPTLPWFRSEDDLPSPLPTIAEIEASTREFPSIFDPSARRTVLVADLFVAKYGPAVFENEGHALLLLEPVREVPIPRLYAMYREADELYIVMEFISGHPLSDIWPSLSEEEKSPIVDQLRRVYDSLRALPSPGIFGGVCGGPLPHRYFFSMDKDPRITGPFSGEEDFCRALVLRSRKNWELLERRGWMTDFFARQLPTVLRGHGSVFTHSDFQRKNILIRERRPSRAAAASAADGGPVRQFEASPSWTGSLLAGIRAFGAMRCASLTSTGPMTGRRRSNAFSIRTFMRLR